MAFSTPAFAAAAPRVGGAYTGLARTSARVCTARSAPAAARRVVAAPPSTVTTTPTAKMFDWKKRADENYAVVEGDVWTLSNLRPAPGSAHRKKRKGRGDAAGQGAACGFGMRGQKSRSGRPTRAGFEGGQTPLYRRLPKFVGRPMGPGHSKTEYALVKLGHLNEMAEGSTVDVDVLRSAGVVTKSSYNLTKVVGGDELTAKNLTVRAHAFTATARAAIEGAGGNCVVLPKTAPKVAEPVAA